MPLSYTLSLSRRYNGTALTLNSTAVTIHYSTAFEESASTLGVEDLGPGSVRLSLINAAAPVWRTLVGVPLIPSYKTHTCWLATHFRIQR